MNETQEQDLLNTLHSMELHLQALHLYVMKQMPMDIDLNPNNGA